MPAGPIGASWEEDSWEDTAWEANSWADLGTGSVEPEDAKGGYVTWQIVIVTSN